MTQYLSEEIIQNRLEKKGIQLLSKYAGMGQNLTCKCYCGKKFTKKASTIVYKSKSCECIKISKPCLSNSIIKERLHKKNIKLLSKYNGIEKNIECECYCGKTFTIKAHNILYRSNSCGCRMYQYKKGKQSYLWKGHGDISAKVWKACQHNAKIRNIEFNINIEYAWNIFEKQDKKCAYSGLPLSFNTTSFSSDGTASIDRIDSTIGYINSNIQWVHKDINFMKWDMNVSYFKYLCLLIIKPYLSKKPIYNNCIEYKKNYFFRGYGNINLTYWTSVIKGAKNRNLCLEITIINAWDLFISQRGYCALTGLPIYLTYNSNQTASLDRIDSSKGYTQDNIQWIHKDINVKLKRNLSESKLREYCKLIVEKEYAN